MKALKYVILTTNSDITQESAILEKYGKEDKFWFLMGKINIFQ